MSEAEYAANVVAAVKFAREQNERAKLTNIRWKVLSIPSTTYKCEQGYVESSGVVDLEVLDRMLSGRWELGKNEILDPKSIAMVCITHIPTNSGIINPVDEIGELIAEHNKQFANDESSLPKCYYLVDACQSAGQLKLDVQLMQCHALSATGRKYLRGPRGTGFLYVQRDIANALDPSHVDHASTPVKRLSHLDTLAISHSIDLTEKLEYKHQLGAARFEFWESNIGGKLGLGEAVDYAIEKIGIEVIEKKCCSLGKKMRSRLKQIPKVRLHHDISAKVEL
jgi:selenocysteine lyase/cysteine desulfurase